MRKEDAWKRIEQGVCKFQTEIYPDQREAFQCLKSGQKPLALFITCADSRVVPNLVTQTDPGEIFTERNPGNIVPPYAPFVGGVTAGVEYAMMVLRVPVIVVCGHTDCGVMNAVLHTESLQGMPGLQEWIGHAIEARNRMLRDAPGASNEERMRLVTEYNVLYQIEHLKTHPSVQSRLLAGEIEIRGWVYDIGDGSIREYRPDTGRFAPIGAAKTA